MYNHRCIRLCVQRIQNSYQAIGHREKDKVCENIIATTKIRNNYDAIQSFKLPILRQQYWTFLLLLVKLSLLILFASFLVSILCFFFDGSLSKDIALPTIAIDSDSCRSFSLLKTIAKRLLLLFANAFKSVKERQLLLSQQLEE